MPRPAHIPKLSESLFLAANKSGDGGALRSPSAVNPDTRPTKITLVLSGTLKGDAADALAQKLRAKGVGKDTGASTTKLETIVYELAQGESADQAADQFRIAHGAQDRTTVNFIQPLPNPPKLPPSAPFPTAFALPTLASESDILNHSEAWAALIKEADVRGSSLEIRLAPTSNAGGAETEKLRDAVEEWLGKGFEESLKSHSESSEDIQLPGDPKGSKIVIDSFGSPPTHLSSDELLRSETLGNWSTFISRVSLHPRTFIKLSPLSLSALLPFANSVSTRTADISSGVLQSAAETASVVSATAEGVARTAAGAIGLSGSPADQRAELGRRLRIILDVVLEAFGEERVFWGASISSSSQLVDAAKQTLAGSLSEPEEWFEIVREKLAEMGISQEGMDKIFFDNARRVYGL